MTKHIEKLNYETDNGLGASGRSGLVVLQSDQTVEHELAGIFGKMDGTALYASRIPNSNEVSPETLRRMEKDLPQAVALLPEIFGLSVIGYACTSGATLIGEQQVDSLIRDIHPHAATTNPITASKAALKALGLKKIALVTPYPVDVTLEMQANFEVAGFETVAVATFAESDDFTVARINTESILNAIIQIGQTSDCEGVFVSCTSLRALGIIPEAEEKLGKPVISSNQALAWHMIRLAGLNDPFPNAGRLFQSELTKQAP